MKKLLSIFMLLVLLLSVVSCGCDAEQTTATTTTTTTPNNGIGDYNPVYADEVRILTLKGPTGMGMANVWNDANSDPDSKYKFTRKDSPDLVKTEVLLGKYDIAALPTNVAAALYNSGKADLQVVAVNTLGVLHIVENGNTVTDVKSLNGKTIHATGGGSTPEFILRYVLKENGIDPDKDVTLTFVADHTELASYLAANVYAIGMLPEPNVSAVLTANKSFRVALDMTEEWNKVTGENASLIQGVFIARKAFIDEHPTVVNAFLDDYNASQKLVNEDPETGANYIVECGIFAKAAVAKKAIPGCNITFLEGDAMKSGVSKCLQVLFDAAPASVGNSLPTDSFYYSR